MTGILAGLGPLAHLSLKLFVLLLQLTLLFEFTGETEGCED